MSITNPIGSPPGVSVVPGGQLAPGALAYNFPAVVQIDLFAESSGSAVSMFGA